MTESTVARDAWATIQRLVRAKSVIVAAFILLVGIVLVLAALLVEESKISSTLLMALGSTLITSSVLSVITEALLRLDTLEPVVSRLDTIEDRLKDTNDVSHLGVAIHRSRREIDFREFAKHSVGHLRIVGISANDILSPSNCDVIFERIRNGHLNRVDVILLDWRSADAERRAVEPAYKHPTSLEQKCKAVEAELAELNGRLEDIQRKGIISLNYVENPPRLSMVIDGEKAVVTPILTTKTGGTSPTLTFDRQGRDSAHLYEDYLAEFKSLLMRT